jgi:hypothetical protein
MSGIVRANNTGQSGAVSNIETIDSDDYVDASIDAAHIAANQVTAAKIFDLARGSVLVGNASAATAELTIGSNTYVLTSDGTDIAWAAASTASHGASSHTDITRTIFIQPGPAGLGPYVDNRYNQMTMEDSVTDTIGTTFYVPADFASFGSIKAVLTTGVSSGNMYWKMDANWAAVGESRETNSETGTIGTTTFSGTKLFHVIEPSDAMGMSGLAAGDYVGVTCSRQAGHANDTVNSQVDFMGLLFTYTANQ